MISEIISSLLQCPNEACKKPLNSLDRQCSFCNYSYDREGNNFYNFVKNETLNNHNRQEVTLHDQLAPRYVERYAHQFSTLHSDYWNKHFIDALPHPSPIVLDCGCGTGDLIRSLAPKCSLVVGLDISSAMLSRGKEVVADQNVLWLASQGETLPLTDSSLDAVCFRGALHHMSNPSKALTESFRVLKSRGKLILSEPNGDSLLLKFPRWLASKTAKRFANDHKSFTSDELKKIIHENGFRVDYTKYLSYLSEPLCGMSDILPLMKALPASNQIAKICIALDEWFSTLPIIKKQSFEYFVIATKTD